MRRQKPWMAALAATVLTFSVACGEGGDQTPTEVVDPPVATTVNVTPSTAQLASIGATVQLTATVLDQRGQPMANAAVTWASSDGSVASVDGSGNVSATTNGSVTITATSGNASGTATVTVAQQPVRVDVSPPTASLSSVGQTVQLTAEAFDANGHSIAGINFNWTSSNASVATVDAAGLVTARRPGNADIAAAASGVRASSAITVSVEAVALSVSPSAHTMFSVGDTLRLSAEVLDSQGNAIPGISVTWASENSGIATVDTEGLVTSVRSGSTNVYAEAGQLADSASISVAQLAVRVELTPDRDTLQTVGDTLRLTAVARDANGNEVVDTDYEWTARHPHVVTVDGNGLVTATGVGSGTIQVKATRAGGNQIGRASITVLQDSSGDAAGEAAAGDAADQIVRRLGTGILRFRGPVRFYLDGEVISSRRPPPP